MVKRSVLFFLLFAINVCAAQEKVGGADELLENIKCCNSYSICSRGPSAAELLQQIQAVLDYQILLLPQLQPQLVAQLEQIIVDGGIPVVGPTGPAGPAGPQGPTGPTGPAGVLDFADFFALMPPDNAATVAIGEDVDFPQDGPSSGTGLIARTGADTFNLAEIGVYQVFFQVSVTEAGQLTLTLNGVPLAYTVVGRATGTSQIIGMALVQTTVINSILTVRNDSSGSALTITPLAGGTSPVSAHLVITRIQ